MIWNPQTACASALLFQWLYTTYRLSLIIMWHILFSLSEIKKPIITYFLLVCFIFFNKIELTPTCDKKIFEPYIQLTLQAAASLFWNWQCFVSKYNIDGELRHVESSWELLLTHSGLKGWKLIFKHSSIESFYLNLVLWIIS